jgi:hypothetical protein
MLDRVGSLSDRLLARLAPRARAAAMDCWSESISAVRLCRTCCNIGGSVGVHCTAWQRC